MNMPLAEIEAANDKSNVLEAVNNKNKNESSDVLDTPRPLKSIHEKDYTNQKEVLFETS
jgi:hypothetical protein